MDFVSTLLVTLKQPAGFWESILNAFKNGTGTYILAVILIALIVRVLFAAVDIINKKVTMKNTDINAKMKPELEAIQKKYGYDQKVLQQKTNELYKKYQFNMVSSCLPMLLMMVLQFTVFLTLWNSLQAVSNYNIANQYQNMKNIYTNIIDLNSDNTPDKTKLHEHLNQLGQDYTLEAEIDFETNKMTIIVKKNEESRDFLFDYQSNWTNEEMFGVIEKFVKQPDPEKPETPPQDQTESQAYQNTSFNEIFKIFAEKTVEKYYSETQEGFLWIKNIYKSESPTSPMFTESEIKNYLSKFYSKDEVEAEKENDYEGKIFANVVAGIDAKALGLNGYYILTIIAVLTSVLSMWLSNFLMKRKDQQKQKQSWMMYIIMPLIIGIFTFMYTSLFAIYLIVGQLVMMLLTPFTTWVVKKWLAADEKKKKDKSIIEVDYRRK